MKEFAHDSFKFVDNGRKLLKQVDLNTVSQSVFKRLVLQTSKNQGLFGKGLIQNPKL